MKYVISYTYNFHAQERNLNMYPKQDCKLKVNFFAFYVRSYIFSLFPSLNSSISKENANTISSKLPIKSVFSNLLQKNWQMHEELELFVII